MGCIVSVELFALAILLVGGAAALWWPNSSRVRRLAHQGQLATDSGQLLNRFLVGQATQFIKIKNEIQLRRTYGKRRSASIEFLGALSAELSVGQPLVSAFERAAASIPVVICPQSCSAARMGGDLAESLKRDAAREQLPALRALSALWSVSEESGASLAAAVARLAESQLASEEIRGTLQAELAGPKATAKVLAGLPVLGMLLGASLGGDPVGWLTGSIWGIAVLITGVGLEVLGVLWVNRMMKAVEKRL